MEEITQDLNSQAWYSLLTIKFHEAEKLINESISLYPQNKFLYTNLPPALLFQGKIKEATALYQKYAKEPFGEQDLPLYKDAFLSDFKEFEEVGIIPEQYKNEVEKIKNMLIETTNK